MPTTDSLKDSAIVAHAMRSIMETLLKPAPGGDWTLEHVADLHTDLRPAEVQQLVRYLESEYFTYRSQPGADTHIIWASKKGADAAKKFKPRQWQALAEEFVRM